MAKKVYVYDYMVLWTDMVGTYMSRTFSRDSDACRYLNKLIDDGFTDASVEMVDRYMPVNIESLDF